MHSDVESNEEMEGGGGGKLSQIRRLKSYGV